MTESSPPKIAVVGVPGGWSSEALCDAIESRTGFRCLVDMDRVWFDSERGVVRYEDINLCDLDGLALKKAGKSYGTLLLDRLEGEFSQQLSRLLAQLSLLPDFRPQRPQRRPHRVVLVDAEAALEKCFVK